MTLCRHHWVLDQPQPGLSTVAARCRKCDEYRDFPAYEDTTPFNLKNPRKEHTRGLRNAKGA